MAEEDGFNDDPARMILRERGYEFCDDRAPVVRSSEHEAALRTAQNCLEDLIVEGVAASSTDLESQGIEQTLQDDMNFWSSEGSAFRDEKEYLVYRLKYPMCLVHTVQISAYRANFQFGQPIYPPGKIWIEVGPSPEKTHKISESALIGAHSGPQIIPLSRGMMGIGGYLRVCMEGKPQMQLADGRHYIAIRYVSAYGLPVPSSIISKVPRALKSFDLRLAPGGTHLPARSLAFLTKGKQPSILKMAKDRCDQHIMQTSQDQSDQGDGHLPDELGRHNPITSRYFPAGSPKEAETSARSSNQSPKHSPPFDGATRWAPDKLFKRAECDSWSVFEFPEQIHDICIGGAGGENEASGNE